MAFLRAISRWLLRVVLLLLAIFAALVALWAFAPPVSTLMLARWVTFRPVERVWTPLERIAPALPLAVIASEDGRFCRHWGVDWGALREVIDAAGEDGPSRGASTIPMQSAKNLFLWPSRSALRKGLEIPAALIIDRVWGKRRVMEAYLNIAEWGEGIFGAEAAARRWMTLAIRLCRTPGWPGSRRSGLGRAAASRAASLGLNCPADLRK